MITPTPQWPNRQVSTENEAHCGRRQQLKANDQTDTDTAPGAKSTNESCRCEHNRNESANARRSD